MELIARFNYIAFDQVLKEGMVVEFSITGIGVNAVFGGFGGAALVYICRKWFSVRIAGSIQTEYKKKLQQLEHDHQDRTQKKQLFFDHQREAYIDIIECIYTGMNAWVDLAGDEAAGEFEDDPITEKYYNDLRLKVARHQIFLDQDCMIPINIIIDAMSYSFPERRVSIRGREVSCLTLFSLVHYVYENLSTIFHAKIQSTDFIGAMKNIAILQGMILLNEKMSEVDVFKCSESLIPKCADYDSMISIAHKNTSILVNDLKKLKKILFEDSYYYNEKKAVDYCLMVLNGSSQ